MRYEQHILNLPREQALIYTALATTCLLAAFALVKRVLQPIGLLLRQASGIAFAALLVVGAALMLAAAVVAGR